MRADYNVPTEEIEERSLYMRLFRSWLDGEKFYHAAFVGTAITRLLEMGHAEAVGPGYVLTKAGMKAWAIMCVWLITRTSIRRESETVNQVLKQIYDDEGENHMSKLMTSLRELLEKLNVTGDWTDVSDIQKQILASAIASNYAERRETGIFRITQRGREYLQGGAAPVHKVKLEAPLDEFAGLKNRLLKHKRIERAELASAAEQAFMSALLREVIVTMTGVNYVLTAGCEEALGRFRMPKDSAFCQS